MTCPVQNVRRKNGKAWASSHIVPFPNRWCVVLDVSVQEMAQCAQSTAVQYSSSSSFKSTCVTWRGICSWTLPPTRLRTKRKVKCWCSGYCRRASHSCCWPYHTEVCLSVHIVPWSQAVLFFRKRIQLRPEMSFLSAMMRRPITTSSMWWDMHFRVRWGRSVYCNHPAWEVGLGCIKVLCRIYCFHVVRFSDMGIEWGNICSVLHFFLVLPPC